MAERKLNFNAPLMSVRRIASRPASPNRDNRKIVRNSSPNRQHTTSIRDTLSEPDFTLEQVTEPVAVPFNWEQIPGQRKDGDKPEPLPRAASITPRVPPGKAYEVTRQPPDTEYSYGTDVRLQIKTQCSFSSNVGESNKFSKEATNERGALELDNEEEDVFSDALDTISSKESVSLNCSASGLSGSDGAGLVKPSGSFLTDPKTRDFMMKRFLPAAKAMALEAPRTYSLKRQASVVQQQPKEVKKVTGEEKRPLNDLMASRLVPQYGDYQEVEDEEEESEEEEEIDHQYDDPRKISMRGCGLFPRLCFRNSLSLLGPVPGLKVRTGTLQKTAYNQSYSKSVKKAWDSAFKQKSDGGSRSSELQAVENKRAGESKRFTYSGDLQRGRLSPFRSSRPAEMASNDKRKTDIRFRSGELKVVGDSRHLTYSGDLQRGRLSPFRQSRAAEMDINDKKKSDIRYRSAELKVVENKLISESRRLTFSGDLQRGGSSPFRNPRAASISPYRNQSSLSPFRRETFLGIPNDESVKAAKNMLSVYNKGSNKFQETSRNKQGSLPMSPAVEKTVYVDTVNNAETLYTNSSSFDNKADLNSADDDFAHLLVLARGMEKASAKSVFQDIKCQNNVEKASTLEAKGLVSIDDKQSCREAESLDSSELAAKGNSDKNSDLIPREDLGDVNSSLVPSPLPPPLPKSPSESWLWRTIPSIPLKNSFFGAKGKAKMPEPKSSSISTKWETIVKTTNLHQDHSRYSEELVAHISKQSKT